MIFFARRRTLLRVGTGARARSWPAIVLLVAVASTTALARGAHLNYFEWSAVAPIVVAGESRGQNGKFIEFDVRRVIRGDLRAEGTIRVDLKRANRERRRSSDPKPLRLDAENLYVLLLEPGPPRDGSEQPVYRLVRGVHGARELPVESADALLDVLQRFIAIHELKNDALTWQELGVLLEETDPLLVVTALEQFRKFRRGEPELTLTLRPLLDHPDEEIREGAARLLAQLLERHRSAALPEPDALRSMLIGLARRDEVVAVRVAATEALAGFDFEVIEPILDEIAADDPDQLVRYAAQKILLERRRAADSADRQRSD